MSRRAIMWLLSVTVLCSIVMSAELRRPYRGKCSIRQEKAHIVLYTVHRGGDESLLAAIGELRDLAREKEIETEKGITLVALNNPLQQPGDHVLTEIRIPVSPDVLKQHAGKLKLNEFDNMTDVKRVPGCRMAIIEKPKGEADVFALYEEIYMYVGERGKLPIYGPQEIFPKDFDPDGYAQAQSKVKMVLWEGGQLPGGE